MIHRSCTLVLLLSVPALAQGPASVLPKQPATPAPEPAAKSPEYRLDASGNWVQIGAPKPGSDEAMLSDARRALAEDRPADARQAVNPFIEANERTSNPLLADAYLIRADALTAEGDEYEALYDYEAIARRFTASRAFITSVEREMDIGIRYVNGLKRKLFGVRCIGASDIGEELLIRVQERMPGSRLAERAGIELADYYYRDHELQLAVEAYDLFIENYPKSQYIERAMQRRIYATIARFKGPKYDGSALIDAKILTERYASTYPAGAEKAGLDEGLTTRLDESAGQAMLENAQWYMRRGDEVSARLIMQRLVRSHPRTAAAQKALETIQEHGWSITPGGGFRAPKPEAGADSGDAPLKIDGKPVDQPSETGDKAAPVNPDTRPPPVEPRRKHKPEGAAKATSPAADPALTAGRPPEPPEPTKP
jgi:tetratricopeptide (TPR) repeat protein